jgi:hypothetical protein
MTQLKLNPGKVYYSFTISLTLKRSGKNALQATEGLKVLRKINIQYYLLIFSEITHSLTSIVPPACFSGKIQK